MSALKDIDPDYGPSVASNEKHQRIYEENARTSTARKITAIIEKEFSQEINSKEKEVLEIQERLHTASKALHLLRYVIVADFYNRKQCQNVQSGETRQTQIHPAIKQLIGKSPKEYDGPLVIGTATTSSNGNYDPPQSLSPSSLSTLDCNAIKTERSEEETSKHYRAEKRSNETDEESRPKKVPRYIPPKSGIPEPPCPSRGIRHKVRKRIIIGNISKWIPPEWREDAASHKWTMYVRGNKENPDIDDFVSKVRFFLHPSYRPNDVVEVTSSPFCLSRRGWGEFPLRVQLHFKSALNKPMDIIHHLKLDRTYTGLQTLGSETLVDIWIYTDPRNSKRTTEKSTVQPLDENGSQIKMYSSDNCDVKVEQDEYASSTFDFANDIISESIDSVSNDCNVIIKQENETEKINENLKNIKRMRFYVDLDHDYCGSTYISSLEENLTIDHSMASGLLDLSEEKEKASEPSLNGDSNTIKVKEETNLDTFVTNECHRGNTTAVPSSCCKVQPNFQLLKISIPPLFEPCGSKRVLVLQDNKTIPVDIAMPHTDDHATKPKINVPVSRGISLLKKPPGSESAIQLRNLNGAEEQRGVSLKLSNSVLLNVNSNVPALQIAETRTFSQDNPANQEDAVSRHQLKMNNQEETKEYKIIRQKITLGKDKHKLQSRKEFYDETFQAIETVTVEDIQGLLRFIVRRMPMVTKDASDSDYKRLHPYSCATEEEYFEYSVAKRNACEWNRAKMMRSFLKKKSFSEEDLWTVKEIMIWARLHGYTPLCSSFTVQSMKQQKDLPDSTLTKNLYTCTEPDAFYKWLQVCPGRSNSYLSESNAQQSSDPDVDVDVLNIETVQENKKRTPKGSKEENEISNTNISVLELERKSLPLYDFVCESAREIGVTLVSEEIVPGVVHCTAGRMMMRAVECLVDDLIRMSLAKAWDRCSDNGYPKVIVLDDVRGALLNREEFDIFTNQGLGSKCRLTAVD